MVAQLTRNERFLAFAVCAFLLAIGLLFAAVGRGDLIAAHGYVIAVIGLAGFVYFLRGFDAPEPSPDRLSEYYDGPTKAGIVLAMFWGVVGMGVGVWIAWLLAY